MNSWFRTLGDSLLFMTMPASEAVDDARSEPRTRTELLLEGIAASSNCRVEAQRNSSPLLPVGSPVLDLAVVVVAGVARKPIDRPAGDGLALRP
jgi:hypothetical protein